MHRAFERTAHRPWPLPKERWVWRQSWRDLLFAHWEVPLEAVRRLVPEPLQVDSFEGRTYLALVPFRMSGVMRRPFPDAPGLSAFPEVNVRVYVTLDGIPGVWFLSLDAPSPIAVWAARRFFHLPYYRSRIAVAMQGEQVHYSSARGDGCRLQLSYGPKGDVFEAASGSLEHWLTERYCLYARSESGVLHRCEVHHWPWPLQAAQASIQDNTMFEPHGLTVHGPPALLHFSRRIDVVMWPPLPV